MKTAHRHASRAKRSNLELPKFWRTKIAATTQLDASLVHWNLIDKFTNGSATASDLWDWMETGFTYTQIMRLHAEDGTEFTPEAMQALTDQVDAYESICERFRKFSRVGFSADEYNTAKAAAEVMDTLLSIDRHGIAERAANWSNEQMKKLRRLNVVHGLEMSA